MRYSKLLPGNDLTALGQIVRLLQVNVWCAKNNLPPDGRFCSAGLTIRMSYRAGLTSRAEPGIIGGSETRRERPHCITEATHD